MLEWVLQIRIDFFGMVISFFREGFFLFFLFLLLFWERKEKGEG